MTTAAAINLYSSHEAAKELGVTIGRIRQICRWSRDPKLPRQRPIGQKIGRDWFLTDDDIEHARDKFQTKSSESQKDD